MSHADDVIEARKPAAGKGGRMTSGSGGGGQQGSGGVDPNAALQNVLGSHGGRVLGQRIQQHAADLAIDSLELATKLEAAGLDKATAQAAAANYVLNVAKAQATGQSQSR